MAPLRLTLGQASVEHNADLPVVRLRSSWRSQREQVFGIDHVGRHDGTYDKFSYNGFGQVERITHYGLTASRE